MKRISMKKIKDVLRLRYLADVSYPKISLATGVPKSTASDYCKRFEISSYKINEFLEFDEDRMYSILFPEKQLPHKTFSRPLPDMNYIAKELSKKGVTFALLWQEYKEANPNGYALSQFKEHFYKFQKKLNPSMRQIHIAGEKMFVDYSGMSVDVIDPKTGEVRKAQIFVSVLGCSGYTFVHATDSQRVADFIKSHSLAFEFYGGIPKIVVTDNLKSAVISNSKKGIVINDNYAELSRHYNFAIEPARPKKPKDKAKVEQGVQAIQRWILAKLRHRVFFSVDEINDAISPLLDMYNNKIIKRIQKSRTKLFEDDEKDYLAPLPVNRFVYKELKVATVNIDYHIELLRCFYSVPYKYLKEKVEVKYSSSVVEIYHKTVLIASHPRLYGVNEVSTIKEHMPLNHQYQTQAINPTRLLAWASNIGPSVKVFTANRLESADHPALVYKNLIAVLSLAKLYGKTELDLALAYAININAKSVKSIESILIKKLYLIPTNNTATTSLFSSHENIRGSEYYK